MATDDVDRVNKKYFYLENIQYCEDLQQYLNKILSMLHNSPEKLLNFRPFVPNLKAEARAKFLQENYETTEKDKEVNKEKNKIEEQIKLNSKEQ